MNRFAYISLLMLTMIVGSIPIIHGAPRKEFTVIIDPGHGGGDIGAPGTIINEKDINLAVALALEEIPGSKREECGNFLEHDLQDAKRELKAYLAVLMS